MTIAASPEEPDEPKKEILFARCPQKIVKDSDWGVIRSLVEKGMTHKEVASQFGISHFTVTRKACKEKWITPMRLARAKNGTISTTDPATVVASIWTSRADAHREQVYQGAHKALSRFFSMSPVPQTFAEAATANKLLKDAIDPTGSNNSNSQVQVNILASNGFSPKPAVDI